MITEMMGYLCSTSISNIEGLTKISDNSNTHVGYKILILHVTHTFS